MKRISDEIPDLIALFTQEGEESKKRRRALYIEKLWKEAVEHVYKDVAPLVLARTNAVYLLKEEEEKRLIIYIEDSLIKSDVDLHQEALKMVFYNHGENIDIFKVSSPKMGMRQRHPYPQVTEKSEADIVSASRKKTITSQQCEKIRKMADVVDDEKLRKALEKAMKASMAK